MTTDSEPLSTRPVTSAQPDRPVYRDQAQEASDRAILGGAPLDHRLADEIAARTETPEEAAIDAANGLRSHGGRRPVPEDFQGLLTPEGDSGDIVGTDVVEGSTLVFGEDGSTKGTIQDGG